MGLTPPLVFIATILIISSSIFSKIPECRISLTLLKRNSSFDSLDLECFTSKDYVSYHREGVHH